VRTRVAIPAADPLDNASRSMTLIRTRIISMLQTVDRRAAFSSYSSTSMAQKTRVEWMDVLRGFAAVLIILLHATLVMERVGAKPEPVLVAVGAAWAGFRMPLLMILSGMLLPGALNKPAETYLTGKISNVLYPYLLWAAIFGVTCAPENLLSLWLWIGGDYLWFLLFLFTYYLIALPLRVVPTGALIVLAAALSFGSPDGGVHTERYFFLMAMFFVGKFLAEKKDLFEWFSSRKAALLTTICAVVVPVVTISHEAAKYEVEYGLPIVGGVLFLMWAAKSVASKKVSRSLKFIGRNAVVYYVVHYPVIFLISLFCLKMGIEEAAVISLLTFIAAFTISTALSLLRVRNGWGEWLYVLPAPARRLLSASMGRLLSWMALPRRRKAKTEESI